MWAPYSSKTLSILNKWHSDEEHSINRWIEYSQQYLMYCSLFLYAIISPPRLAHTWLAAAGVTVIIAIVFHKVDPECGLQDQSAWTSHVVTLATAA